MSAETFEQTVADSQTSGDYNPTWKRFVKTRFFVPLARAGAGPQSQQFKLAKHPQSGKSIVTIAEDRQLLEERGENAAHLHGADILKLLSPEIGILVALSDRSFGIPAGLVTRLKQSLEAAAAAKAKAVQAPAPANAAFPRIEAPIVQREAPLAQAAPAPSPSSSSLTLEPIAVAAPVKKAVPKSASSYLDVAALRPRQVAIEHLGLNFYVPGAWKESKLGKSLEFADPEGGLKFEAGGTIRSGRSVDQWLAMRTQTLAHDMPYLKQSGDAYSVEGEDWGDRVVARVAEFRGIAPGTSEEQSCLLCCLRTESVLACIVISAETDVFENSRALFKWLLPRINVAARAEDQVEVGNTIDDGLQSHASLVASGHRMTIVSVLGNAALLTQAQHLHAFVLIFLVFAIAGFGCFGLYRIAQGLRFPIWAKVLFFIGVFIPVVSLILILAIRWSARSFLKSNGYRVGLLGAHDAIDDSNHDMRNTLIVALLLALPLYGLVHLGEKRFAASEPVEFMAPDHSFSVVMRGTPTEMDSASRAPGAHVWAAHTSNRHYLAGYNDVQTMVTDPDLVLHNVTTHFASMLSDGSAGSTGTILSDFKWDVEGHPGRKVVASLANGEFVTSQYVLVGLRLYTFTVDVPVSDKETPDIDSFLDSISIGEADR